MLQSKFYHFGTQQEYLFHLCVDPLFRFVCEQPPCSLIRLLFSVLLMHSPVAAVLVICHVQERTGPLSRDCILHTSHARSGWCGAVGFAPGPAFTQKKGEGEAKESESLRPLSLLLTAGTFFFFFFFFLFLFFLFFFLFLFFFFFFSCFSFANSGKSLKIYLFS